MSIDTPHQKSVIRKFALAARKKTHQEKGESVHDSLIKTFQTQVSHLIPTNPVVSTYLPINSEINPLPLMLFLRDKYQARLCLPVIVGKHEALIFRPYNEECEMEKGRFNTSQPKYGQNLSPDIIIAPLLAFDKKGFRIGYGGGFYDRTFSIHKKALKLGLAFSEQMMSNPLPKDIFDKQLNGVITPDKYWKFQTLKQE